MKKICTIIKDYFSLVSIKNKDLFLFICSNILTTAVSLIIPVFTSLIVEKLTLGLYNKALFSVFCLFIFYILHNLFLYADYYFYATFFKNTYIDMHGKIINSVYQFKEEFTKKISFGKIINSSNMDIVNIAELPSFIFNLMIQIINFLIIIFIFLRKNILIGIYVLLINLLYSYYASYCNTKNAYFFTKQKKCADKLTGLLAQTLNGLKDIKSYSLADKINSKFDGYRKKWGVNYFLKRKYFFFKQTIVTFIIQFGKIILYIFLIFLVSQKKLSIASFLMLISYYEKAKSSIGEIMSCNMSISEESISMYRIKEIINGQNENINLIGNIYNDNIIGKIEFKNVSFKYEKLPTLKNISFQINPNEITTIIGKTGAGKTTIFNLLLRFYKPQSGKMLIDDIDIFEYNDKVYNSNVTVVNQKPFLFNMSIRQNLSLIDANKERQINACKRVGIHDFIMSLPNDYNTILTENTTNISGGQKQLLSLARALLTTSEIILLDEVTSSLDPNTTNKIINLLDDLKTDHTVVIITHNKDLMKIADNIIVLNSGKIECIGKHKDLIKNNAIYKKLQN